MSSWVRVSRTAVAFNSSPALFSTQKQTCYCHLRTRNAHFPPLQPRNASPLVSAYFFQVGICAAIQDLLPSHRVYSLRRSIMIHLGDNFPSCSCLIIAAGPGLKIPLYYRVVYSCIHIYFCALEFFPLYNGLVRFLRSYMYSLILSCPRLILS
jgi:hypothetical protein